MSEHPYLVRDDAINASVTGGYDFADIKVAEAKCGSKRPRASGPCIQCYATVIWHCTGCRVQVTGCFCTDVARFGLEEAKRRVIYSSPNRAERRKKEVMERRKKGQVWTPNEMHGD